MRSRVLHLLLATLATAAALAALPAGWSWAAAAPLDPELAPPSELGLPGRSGPLLALLPGDPGLRRWSAAVLIGAGTLLLGSWVLRAFGRGSLWAVVPVVACHPAALAARLDPAAPLEALRLLALVGVGIGATRNTGGPRAMALGLVVLCMFLGVGTGLSAAALFAAALAACSGTPRGRSAATATCAILLAGLLVVHEGPGTHGLQLVMIPASLYRRPGGLVGSAGSWLPLLLLGLTAWRGRRAGDGRRTAALLGVFAALLLAARPAAPGPLLLRAGSLLPAAAATGLLLAACLCRVRPLLGDRMLAAGALVLWLLASLGAARRHSQELAIPRREAGRLHAAVRALPGRGTHLVLLPGKARPAYGPHLPRAFPERDVRVAPRLVDPGPGELLRVSLWSSATPLASHDPRAHELRPGFLAQRPQGPGPRLLAPSDGAVLPARGPRDEPVFTFAVPEGLDPGPSGLAFVAIRRTRPHLQGGPLLKRELDHSVLSREDGPDLVVYRWRPSIRSTVHAERELLWEHEDLAPRGTSLTWTVLVKRPGAAPLMASPRSIRIPDARWRR